MKTIKLIGDIAEKYKQDWKLDVQTPAEALRAINANRPGFIQECDAGNYIAILVDLEDEDNTRQITDENGLKPWGSEVLVVVPNVSGDASAAAAFVVGALFTAAAATSAAALIVYAIVYVIVSVAIAVALAAISSLISSTPDAFGANELETPENKPSYLFNGVVNTARQGHRIPLLYGGPLLVGSAVLSSRINTTDL